jgi:hypothetical protein
VAKPVTSTAVPEIRTAALEATVKTHVANLLSNLASAIVPKRSCWPIDRVWYKAMQPIHRDVPKAEGEYADIGRLAAATQGR